MIVNDKIAFEDALAELERTVQRLESGGLTLEESLALFELGQKLAARCEAALNEAELRLEQLRPKGKDEYEVKPFTPGE
jgi:exodeoxyribonuclease VII small subunit